jgi:hypothetical protein
MYRHPNARVDVELVILDMCSVVATKVFRRRTTE